MTTKTSLELKAETRTVFYGINPTSLLVERVSLTRGGVLTHWHAGRWPRTFRIRDGKPARTEVGRVFRLTDVIGIESLTDDVLGQPNHPEVAALHLLAENRRHVRDTGPTSALPTEGAAMADRGNTPRPLSDRLLEAATRIDELSHQDVARLLVKAAIRLRTIQHTGARLEHVPVYAYHLLRRLSQGPVSVATLHGRDDEQAAAFLISRGLAAESDARDLVPSPAGLEIGEIADERDADISSQ